MDYSFSDDLKVIFKKHFMLNENINDIFIEKTYPMNLFSDLTQYIFKKIDFKSRLSLVFKQNHTIYFYPEIFGTKDNLTVVIPVRLFNDLVLKGNREGHINRQRID